MGYYRKNQYYIFKVKNKYKKNGQCNYFNYEIFYLKLF